MDIASDFFPFLCFVYILLLRKEFPKVFSCGVRSKGQKHGVKLRVMTLNPEIGVNAKVVLHVDVVAVHEVKHLICDPVFFLHVAATVLQTGFVLPQFLQQQILLGCLVGRDVLRHLASILVLNRSQFIFAFSVLYVPSVGEPHVTILIDHKLSLHLQNLIRTYFLKVVRNFETLLVCVLSKQPFVKKIKVVRHRFEVVIDKFAGSRIVFFV